MGIRYNKTKSTCTEIFISAFPKLLVWVIAIGISGSKIQYYDDSYNMIHISDSFWIMQEAPVLMKAKVTHVSDDHYTCSIQWYSVESANSTESKTQDRSENLKTDQTELGNIT